MLLLLLSVVHVLEGAPPPEAQGWRQDTAEEELARRGLGMDRWSVEQVEQFVLVELGATRTVKALAQQFRANHVNGHDFRLLDAEMLSDFGANKFTRTKVLRLRQRYLEHGEGFAHPLPHMLVPAKPALDPKRATRPRPLIDPNAPSAKRRLCVLGERNSGTSLIERTLLAHFRPYACTPQPTRGRATAQPFSRTPLGFKHLFDRTGLTEEELELARNTNWIIAVRNPCSWLDGMFRKPHHRCPIPCDRKKHTVANGNPAEVLRENLTRVRTQPPAPSPQPSHLHLHRE